MTPFGLVNFTNIIATLYPEADHVIALSAHYDSKFMEPKNGKYFLGATDSAVPCAMLLDIAKVLSEKARNHPRVRLDHGFLARLFIYLFTIIYPG